jgi:hypothetical protein
MNVLFIRDTIYRLKQDFGRRMDLYILDKADVDARTGLQTTVKRKYTVPRGVLLPSTTQRFAPSDIALLTAGRQFAHSNTFDVTKTNVILEKKDVPKGVKITASDWFVIDHIRYNVTEVTDLEFNLGWVVTLTNTNTRFSNEIVELRVSNSLQFEQLMVVE